MTTATPPIRRALYRALHDPLTGLPNRTVVLDRLTNALVRAPRRPGAVAVLLVDLDRFKLVNDALGHAAGDALLIEVAQRLDAVVRSTDLLGRCGGDEFVVVAEDIADLDALNALAGRLREAVARPITLAVGDVIVVTASVGIALVPATENDAPPTPPADLLWDAEAAMYRAKECGRDRVHLFEDGLRAPSLGRFRSEAALRRALEGGHLRLHYQPIVDLTLNRLVGMEALVRLDDPERGLVPPGEFISVAEDSGLIVPLGAWVTAEAARRASEWATTMFVNLSGGQLTHPGFLPEVRRAVDEAGVEPSRLCFEISENTLLDAGGPAMRNLLALKETGVRLAIDDFGTGHASLRWLRQVPVDVLKIDRGFVAGIGQDGCDDAIVAAVAGLARDLGLITVAEGVETERQRQVLASMGCDWAQGYHFSRAVPAEFAGPLLDEDRHW